MEDYERKNGGACETAELILRIQYWFSKTKTIINDRTCSFNKSIYIYIGPDPSAIRV